MKRVYSQALVTVDFKSAHLVKAFEVIGCILRTIIIIFDLVLNHIFKVVLRLCGTTSLVVSDHHILAVALRKSPISGTLDCLPLHVLVLPLSEVFGELLLLVS